MRPDASGRVRTYKMDAFTAMEKFAPRSDAQIGRISREPQWRVSLGRTDTPPCIYFEIEGIHGPDLFGGPGLD